MVYSVTEGDDKPLKYPVMFRAVDVVLLNKIDLVPYLDVDLDSYVARVREVNPTATILQSAPAPASAWPIGSAGYESSQRTQRPEPTAVSSQARVWMTGGNP